jgi:hypothetical protein
MPIYLLAYHGGGMPTTAEEQPRVMAAWGQWYQSLGEAVVDGGNPVSRSLIVASDGSVRPGSGPTAISGYSIIAADDMDGALAAAKACPILEHGGSVEVGETFSVR